MYCIYDYFYYNSLNPLWGIKNLLANSANSEKWGSSKQYIIVNGIAYNTTTTNWNLRPKNLAY